MSLGVGCKQGSALDEMPVLMAHRMHPELPILGHHVHKSPQNQTVQRGAVFAQPQRKLPKGQQRVQLGAAFLGSSGRCRTLESGIDHPDPLFTTHVRRSA